MNTGNASLLKEGYPRTGFVFYASFYEALKEMNMKNKTNILHAIIEYGLYGKEPVLKGVQHIVFKLIKPQLDANHRKFLNGRKGGEHGVKRGKAELKKPALTPCYPHINPTTIPKEKDNVNVNGNMNTICLTPPSLEEVVNYFQENGYSKELAERAYRGYDVAEWKDSTGNAVKNWKQKCQHVWFKPENKQTPVISSHNYETGLEKPL